MAPTDAHAQDVALAYENYLAALALDKLLRSESKNSRASSRAVVDTKALLDAAEAIAEAE